jgi:Activator of Hsp90 ATPase homolog 1-like protein
LKLAPEQLLEYTYWSSLSGLADSPENYTTITWLIEKEREGVTLTVIVKDNVESEEVNDRLKWRWQSTMSRLAKLAEEQ